MVEPDARAAAVHASWRDAAGGAPAPASGPSPAWWTRGRAGRAGPRPLPAARLRGGGGAPRSGPSRTSGPRARIGRRRQGRQLRGAEEDARWARAPRRRTSPTSATPRSGRRVNIGRRHHHLQLRRRQQAPHAHRGRGLHRQQHHAGGAGDGGRRRLRRARAARSPRTCPPQRPRRWAGARQVVKEGWARRRKAPRARRGRGEGKSLAMCGIVGYVGTRDAVPVILEGLRRLEYRGYDSAGVAVVRDGGCCAAGARSASCATSRRACARSRSPAQFGLGHTRWATHGRPSEENAHPHQDCQGRVVVVHNGIIENYLPLKTRLSRGRATASSPRPTPRSWRTWWSRTTRGSLEAAVRQAVRASWRASTRWCSCTATSRRRWWRRAGPAAGGGPGRGRALPGLRHPGPAALHARLRVPGRRRAGRPSRRERVRLTDAARPAGGARAPAHHLGPGAGGEGRLPPLHAQGDPRAAARGARHAARPHRPRGGRRPPGGAGRRPRSSCARAQRVLLLACGTSWHAALVGKFLLEQVARRPGGGGLRQRVPLPHAHRGPGDTLAVAISQSGETADTLAAFREAKRRGALPIAICNVQGSMLTREAAGTLLTHAGPEIGVASTKAFTVAARGPGAAGPAPGPPARHALRATRCRDAPGEPGPRAPPHGARAARRSGRIDELSRVAVARPGTSCSWAAASTTRSRSRAR